jgi:hypothetical protein
VRYQRRAGLDADDTFLAAQSIQPWMGPESLLLWAPGLDAKVIRGRARARPEAEHLLHSYAVPSPGIARKLVSARGLVDAVWLLVLVSHDEALARACTTSRLHILRGAFSSAKVYATNDA